MLKSIKLIIEWRKLNMPKIKLRKKPDRNIAKF